MIHAFKRNSVKIATACLVMLSMSFSADIAFANFGFGTHHTSYRGDSLSMGFTFKGCPDARLITRRMLRQSARSHCRDSHDGAEVHNSQITWISCEVEIDPYDGRKHVIFEHRHNYQCGGLKDRIEHRQEKFGN
jgi:hypothetical protein